MHNTISDTFYEIRIAEKSFNATKIAEDYLSQNFLRPIDLLVEVRNQNIMLNSSNSCHKSVLMAKGENGLNKEKI